MILHPPGEISNAVHPKSHDVLMGAGADESSDECFDPLIEIDSHLYPGIVAGTRSVCPIEALA
jgi:hypothetical protein